MRFSIGQGKMAAAVTSEADILSRVSRSVKRSRDMFLADYGSAVAEDVFRYVFLL